MKKLIFIISILAVALVVVNVWAFSLGFSSPAFAIILIIGDVQLAFCAYQAIFLKQQSIKRERRLSELEAKK